MAMYEAEDGYVQVAVELPLSACTELADMELMEVDARGINQALAFCSAVLVKQCTECML